MFPAGIGSETFTPVAVLGPLFVTTIVQVMFPVPRTWVAGAPVLLIARSTRACTQTVASEEPEPSLPVVTWPVLSTTPVPGQSPPVAPVVGEVMCTVNVLAAWVVLCGTVTPFAPPQLNTPAAIAQLPAPATALRGDRPGQARIRRQSVTQLHARAHRRHQR